MSKIRPEIATQRIEFFEKRFGIPHLYFAYHAAFPLALTPNLLYRLWANFQRDIHAEVLGIPWIAVGDLLLSGLCHEVGHELYRMDMVVRNILLKRLQGDKKFGQQRINEVSDFLLDYVKQQLQSDDPDIKDFAQAQQWTALAYTQPSKAARELALAFSKLDQMDKAELIRMASLIETFVEPLAEFQNLFIYAHGMENFARGNLGAAKTELAKVLEGGKQIQVAGVSLPIPNQIKANFPDLAKPKLVNTPISLLGILSLLLVGSATWYYLWQFDQPANSYIMWSRLVRNFSEVPNVPLGFFSYTGEKDSTWSFILTQPVDDNRLGILLAKPRPDATAIYTYESVLSADINNPIKSIEEVQTGKKDFAITSLENKITSQLKKEQIAYDGLIVFVAFNKRDSNLANALGGQISLEQLRQIYTGKITNWQQINTKLPNSLEIKPFAPTEPEAIAKFQEIVLQNDPQDKALFAAKVTKQDTTKTQNQIRSEILEGRATGIISFGIISKTWTQCTGYPLAIVDGNNPASQPLFQRRDRRSITPSDDLCQHDDYYVDIKTFQSYPLGYPLFVVYPQDSNRLAGGSTFARMLTTRQGQCLLSKVGLVALQPIPDNINSYACKSVP